MIDTLKSEEIEVLLHSQIVGRIGCHSTDIVYVVPISYAYDGEYIYCHGFEGKKMELMRGNPEICFQVDEMKDMSRWKSVIAWGKFEELNDRDEKNKALQLLLARKLPIISSITTHLGETWPFTEGGSTELGTIPGIVLRIKIKKKTGRFESTPNLSTPDFG